MRSNTLKILLVLLILTLIIGCTSISDSITEQEARNMVIEKHENNIGDLEIISIEIKRNAYIIEWENKDNREWGIDKVTKDGEVKMIEATIE